MKVLGCGCRRKATHRVLHHDESGKVWKVERVCQDAAETMKHWKGCKVEPLDGNLPPA
jgi:uncharacterized protein (DUF2384 family)